MTDRRIYAAEDAEKYYKASAGQSYRPSNGTEGEMFQSTFCADCHYERFSEKDPARGCKILTYSLIFDKGDKDYPKEWVYGADGQPTCTKFAERGTVKHKRRNLGPSKRNAAGDLFKKD